VAVIRLQDLSMGQLIDLTIFKIVQAALSEKRARCNDEHGACEVIQQAIEKQKEIYLFLSSGTGLVIDQSGGYSYQIQRALDLVNCKSFGGARNGMFRRIIFLAHLYSKYLNIWKVWLGHISLSLKFGKDRTSGC